MPRLAAFPKAFMDALCIDGTMSVRQWIELAATLDIDGLEFYAGILNLDCAEARRIADDHGLTIPMYCCSPDFTHPDPAFRREQIDREKRWIDQTRELGGSFCRVLSGQRRPEVSREDGLRYAAESIEACLPHAAAAGVTLILENHYKDNYWQYPEFAQHMDLFCELVDRVRHPHFGVNYDPSNTLICDEDPLELLRRVRGRVVTMHASDRRMEGGELRHGVIGEGLNDYDAIFSELASAGFDGWISIEDGVNGIDEMRRSAVFLRQRIAAYWPAKM